MQTGLYAVLLSLDGNPKDGGPGIFLAKHTAWEAQGRSCTKDAKKKEMKRYARGKPRNPPVSTTG